MFGDSTCVPLVLTDGTVLVPAQVTPVGPDGMYHNPGGGLTYHDAVVIAGRWRDDERLEWQMLARIEGDPERSTRGMVEPTLGLLEDRRILVVMRGSNDVRPQLPGHRWYSISGADRQSWSPPRPWTYTDGEPFHSPSSCSQLLHHSSGRLLWIGNLTADNPRGNSPRYPLVVAEVDRTSGLVLRDTVTAVDDRGPDETEALTLSNFHALEDRQTGELLVTLPRYFAHAAPDPTPDFTADLTLLRCALADNR